MRYPEGGIEICGTGTCDMGVRGFLVINHRCCCWCSALCLCGLWCCGKIRRMDNQRQRILTNSVKFHFVDDAELFYKYAVNFYPELPSPVRRNIVIQQFHRTLGKLYLFDDLRNTLYLPQSIETLFSRLLNYQVATGIYRIRGRTPYFEDKHIDVEFKRILVSAVPSSRHTHAFLTVLLRRGFEILGLQKFGDGAYDTQISLTQYKVHIRNGIRFGTRENELEPMLWIEPSSLVRRTQSLLDVLASFDTQDNRMAAFDKFVISKMIRTPTRTKGFYPVHHVRWDLNPGSTFAYNDEQITFVDYYRNQFGIEIKDVTQPLLVSKCGVISKNGRNTVYDCQQPMIVEEFRNFIIHLPELCYTCDILKEAKRDKLMSDEIEKYVNPSPQKIACILNSYLDQLQSSDQVTKLFRQWNVELDSSFVETFGKVLPGPNIMMNSSTIIRFSDSPQFSNLEAQVKFWKLAGSLPFYSVVPLLHWILVCTLEDRPLALQFSESFESTYLGLQYIGVKSVCTILVANRVNKESTAESYVSTIRRAEQNFQLVAFIIPRTEHVGVYPAVKNLCTTELGVPSQGILAKTIQTKGLIGIVRSIASQVCSKIGGAPWALDVHDDELDGTMTIGIDAYHSRKRSCSVYAVIFTLNPQCTKYYTRTIRQLPGKETCDILAPMFFHAYVEFYKECGRWPSKVIVFRDGVSNMYLSLLKDHELAQIKRSLELLSPRPKLIVVIIQKYTTDRFMLLHGESVLNPMPGTVVDTTVTRTDFQDFFIFSQMSRGKNVSVQPTRCVVLEDEVGNFEFVQKATYASSFTYFNWKGSIRIPAVCQYAHKAAGFVGYILKDMPSERLQNKLYYL